MKKVEQIKERLYAPSLAYENGFEAGQKAENEFYKHAGTDIHYLLGEIQRLEEDNAILRKCDHERRN